LELSRATLLYCRDYLLPEEPLITLFSALRIPYSSLGSLSLVLGVCLWVIGFAKEPVKGFFWGTIRSYYGGFSSFIYRVALHLRTPVSGGGGGSGSRSAADMKHFV